MQVRYKFIIIFLLCSFSLSSGVKKAVRSINIVNIKSEKQKILEKNKLLLEGDVEVLFDNKVQILADKVEFDKDTQNVVATSTTGFVKLENQFFVMLAERIEVNIEKKTGSAKNLKIHIKDGFLSASKAEKIDDQTWKMERIVYTACDKTVPHWAFTAYRAKLYRNTILKASGLVFKIKDIPVLAFPALVFPLQNRAGSGFLMPRLSFDAELGFGFRQKYYWLLGPHCDTTLGFNFVEKKGYILSDEFRWAKSNYNFLIVNSYYAEEWNALLEKQGRIVNAKDKHYWIQGEYFQPYSIGPLELQSLVRFDFGTDKRIGYHFLDSSENVEDSFYNSITQRYHDSKNLMQFLIQSERGLRKQFRKEVEKEVNQDKVFEQHERVEKVRINYFPRFEWNTGYHKIFPHVFYRHDFSIDHLFLESKEEEKLYINRCLDSVESKSPKVDMDTTRLFYKGRLESNFRLLDQSLSFYCEPHFLLRGKVKDSKASRHKFFPKIGGELAFHERALFNKDHTYLHYIQPVVKWNFLPKFYQNGWYYIDKQDRFYPENSVSLELRNNWKLNNWSIDLLMSQGYDFYGNSNIFNLRRAHNQKRLLPFRASVGIANDGFHLNLAQEYGIKSPSVLQSELVAGLSFSDFDFFVGYLYQREGIQKSRELLSDIPAFALIGATVPIGSDIKFHYNGSFFTNYRHSFPIFNIMKPMLHRFKLNYEKHCWAISLGFEERRYRQYGRWKSERSITLAIRLESIGSFAQKFKPPSVSKAPQDYRG